MSFSFLVLLTIWLNCMVKVKDSDTSQERILAAAKKVFLAKGLSGARMQDIADEAGINKALLHYYFRNKEKLFEVIFKDAAGQLFPTINMIFESESPLFEKLSQFCEEYITVILKNPYLPLFVLNEINRDPQHFLHKIWGEKYRPKPQKFLAQIEHEVAKGTIVPVSPIQLLINLLS